MPFRGSVRHEDIMTQGTQGRIDERDDRLAASDRGVILLRKSILNAMKAAQKGHVPQGVVTHDRADEIIKIDSFTGIRAKGVF